MDVSDPYEFELLDSVLVMNGQAYCILGTEVNDRLYFAEFGGGQTGAGIATVNVKTPEVLSDLSDLELGMSIPPIDGDTLLPVALFPISDDLLIDVVFYYDGAGGYPPHGYGPHLISIADQNRPGYVTHLDIPATVTGADWFGNWGYFADQGTDTLPGGLTYVNLGE